MSDEILLMKEVDDLKNRLRWSENDRFSLRTEIENLKAAAKPPDGIRDEKGDFTIGGLFAVGTLQRAEFDKNSH